MAGFAPAPLPHLSLVLEEVVTGSAGEAAFLPHVGLVFEPNQFTLTCEAGSYALTGQDAALRPARKIIAAAAAFTLTGQDSTGTEGTYGSVEWPASLPHLSLVLTGVSGVYGLVCGAGSFALTGQDAALTKGIGIVAETGVFVLTGAPAERDMEMNGDAAAFTLTGEDAGLYVGRPNLTADVGTFALNGFAANLQYDGADKVMAGFAGPFALSGQDATFVYTRAIEAETGVFTLTGEASTYDTTGTVTSTGYPAPAGRSRRKRQSVVDVDGEIVRVNSRAEADELLKRIRAQAKEDAPKAAKRALNKARDIARKEGVFPDVRVEPPRVEPVDTSYALAAMIERINADVAKEYERAQREAELAYLARKTYIEQDEEDALIALLL